MGAPAAFTTNMTPMSLLLIVMRLHEACLLTATHATDTNLSASCRSSGLRLARDHSAAEINLQPSLLDSMEH